MGAANPDLITLSGVVAVVLVNTLREHQTWAWMRLVQGPGALKDTPGLIFAKVMGSGHEGGFGLRPSASHQGLITIFDHADQARAFLSGAVVNAYRERSTNIWTGLLEVVSARGLWDGQAWGITPETQLGAYGCAANDAQAPQPLAALTRASIRPAKAMAFWRNAPAAQLAMQHAKGCTLAMGLGEAPLVRQCTFSLWHDTASMLAYAHQGAHQAAIEAAYRHNYFSESMFVRMRVLEQKGLWPSPASQAAAQAISASGTSPEPLLPGQQP
jgi:spheroidene monooxygenase